MMSSIFLLKVQLTLTTNRKFMGHLDSLYRGRLIVFECGHISSEFKNKKKSIDAL